MGSLKDYPEHPKQSVNGLTWVDQINELKRHAYEHGMIGPERPSHTQAGQKRSPDDPIELLGMLASRLRGKFRFSHVHCQLLDPERVAVFLIANNQAVTIEDNYDLFPSDALITKLRLLDG
jgi:hypothetical protein